jgi:ribosome-binding ATPase YchF (GTP1/OBG family)
MSDEEQEYLVEDQPTQTTKPKRTRTMTPEALERLKVAREKAAQVKRAARAEKDKIEQDLKEKEKAMRLAKMQEKVEKDLDEKPATLSSSSATLSSSSATLEDRPKNRKKKPVVIMHNSDSDSSEGETQVIYIPKKRSNKPKNAPAKDVLPQEQQLPPIQIGYAPRSMPPRPFNSFY